VLGGLLAAAVAAAVGLAGLEVLVTALGLGDGRSTATFGEVAQVGVALWLLGHGATMQLPEGVVTLLPLGVTAFAGALLHRAGRLVGLRVLPRGRRGIPAVAAAVALPYAVLNLVLALLVGSSGPVPSVWRAGFGSVVLALGAAGLGAAGVLAPDRLAFLHRGGRVLRFSGPAPSAPKVALRAALTSGGVLLAGAALLAGISLATHLSTAADLAKDTTGGTISATGVLVVQLALLPNLLIWFLAYAVGPGFGVGSGTDVQLIDGHLGEVPALPMFGGLPGHLPVPALLAVLLIPLAAGVLGGRVVAGRMSGSDTRKVALTALAVGPLTGGLVAVAVAFASGRVLGGDLSHVGACFWTTGLAAALEVGLIALLTALLVRWRQARRTRRKIAGPAAAVQVESEAGAHRRGERNGAGRRRFGRPSWARRPGWARQPSWLHRPAGLHLPARVRRPSWLRRRRKVVQLPD
jgi:hypothetical protein